MKHSTKIKCRKYRRKSSMEGIAKDKKRTRKQFRAKIKISDRKTEFDGIIPPNFSDRDIV